MRELAQGLSTQTRVIFALALRETRTRFGQHRLGYVWALLEPLIFIMTFWVMFKAINRDMPGGMAVVPFLTTGVIPYEIAMKTTDRVSLSVEANRALLFYPQVQTLDIAFARAFLELATFSVVTVAILGVHGLVVQEFAIQDPLRVLQGFLLATGFGLSLGLVLCALTVMSPVTQRVKGPLFRPVFWISGLFFAAEMLPLRYREYVMWNPILHCVEIVRDGWFVEYTAHSASGTFVLMNIVVLLFIGLTLERRTRVKVQLT
ncbi:MAG: ABC transporter permease [Sandaracinaceae bacterium]